MRLYIAGLYTSNFGLESRQFKQLLGDSGRALRTNVQHHLESYHYIHKGKYVQQIRKDGVKVFLDSGAFSAFSLGVDVSIEAYAEFVKGHQDMIEMASVLDAIGDPEGTFYNQQTLERLGAEVLPCFHFGEPLDLCEYYIRNYDYITIGGMVPIPNNRLEPWLDEVWDRVLTDRDGYARKKVHGFGLTSRKLMAKYPWYSCDSSSWVQAAANGNIVLPDFDKAIAVSESSPARKKYGAHFNSYSPEAQRRILAVLKSLGLELDDVAKGYANRWALCAYSYDQMGRHLGEDHWRKPFKGVQPLFF